MDFPGSSRFEVRRRLGAGGMGVVYEAFDRDRGAPVALKTLHHLDPDALYRFKREFRALADITHPNLVRFHELVGDGDLWFFTMELVGGVDVLRYIWGAGTGDHRTRARSALRSSDGATRLRGALGQLVGAVDAVHRAGKLHRDVKPGNVIVEPSGRLVLLDFGIATDLRALPDASAETDRIVGTPAYMAPEQVDPETLTEAADWYAVGAVLYEALTGRVPFEGTPIEMLIAKRAGAPPRPSEVAPEVPRDLDDLCVALLASRPEDRPAGAEVVAWCADIPGGPRSAPAPSSRAPRVTSPPRRPAFVGRATMLATMRAALDGVRRGRPAVVHVVGRSGMGKSALVRQFLSSLEGDPNAVVLVGRCYERELVSYKGFDALVDALSRYLAALPPAECAALVPDDARALVRVFPVLDRVDAFAEATRIAPGAAAETSDPHQIRTRAFGALRSLFTRLAERRTVVLHIDDLQWGDADSAALLAELTDAPDPPPILVIVAYRAEDVGAQPWLGVLERTARGPSQSSPPEVPASFACQINVDALDTGEAVALAAVLLGVGESDPRAAAIAAESRGSPFFIGELVRHAQASDEGSLRLGTVLESRINALPPASLRLLRLTSIAAHPIDRGLLMRAADLAPGEGEAALAALRATQLVRVGAARRDDIEPSHDRIREAVVERIEPPSLRALHGRMASTMVASGDADPELLFSHFEEAGELDRAGEYAEAAAKRASAQLAFDRAANLYQRALALTPESAPRAQALRLALADSLARAGRGVASADAYMAAAAREQGARALDLRKRASEQILFSGRIDRGVDLVQQVLASEGMRLAASPLLALIGLLFTRLLVMLRGTKYRKRLPSEVSPALLARIDTCTVVANGLSFVDNIQGRLFQARAFLLALRAGEPSRLLHALCGEAVFRAASGVRSAHKALALLAEARRLSADEHVRDQRGTIEYGQGMVHHITGNWVQARECFEKAEALFAGMGESFFRIELDGAQSYGVVVLVLLGRLNEARRRHAARSREAEERGDLFLSTNLSIGFANQLWLFADQPKMARAVAAEAMAPWSSRGFHMQHWHELLAMTEIDLYEGEPERAYQRITAKWPLFKKSMLLRIEMVRLLATYLRGAAATALVAREVTPERAHTDDALRCARVLTEHGQAWTTGAGSLLRAGVLALDGDTPGAIRELATAAAMFDEASLALFAAATRRRLGVLRGDAVGATMVTEADAWMRAEGIRRPERVAAMIAPGFGRG